MGSLLNPIQRWVWRDPVRRGHRLLRFAEVEADGGRDLARAAELTADPKLRRLYLRHAQDEQRHAEIFRRRGTELLRAHRQEGEPAWQPDWLAPGERGLDDVSVEAGGDGPLLAFLHLSEAAAARGFVTYREAVGDDRETRIVFATILKDEEFHMTYTRHELARVSPRKQGWLLWKARFGRLWKGYLRLAVAIAGVMGAVILTLQYFILLPPFAWGAKRAAKRETEGWRSVAPKSGDLKAQY
ncbi:MAG TPA: ferritin-like domain-containing protein [Allosphingosinicella sp.]|nr:ferritin-like domain-containing protein [Allosphingosinicella sp.]